MQPLNWADPREYTYTASLNAAQWAWEFLRRNPAYQGDWAWFSATWRRLESRYGKPPERDFQRWKRDPEAYRHIDGDCGECAVDRDRVLIECWMGEKWGFYKFPLAPDTRQPVIGEQLTWRAADEAVEPVTPDDRRYLGEDPRRVALGFDLALPLRPQLEAARHYLQVARAAVRRDKTVRMLSVGSCRNDWRIMLRLLDAVAQGADLTEVYAQLSAQGEIPDDGQFEDLFQAARMLASGAHRQVLSIPDR